VGSRPTRILARGAPHRRLGRVARHGTGPLRSRGDRAQACRSWERRRREPTVRGFDSLPARSARGTPSTAVDRPLRPGVVVKRYDQLRSKRPRSPSTAVDRRRRSGAVVKRYGHAGPTRGDRDPRGAQAEPAGRARLPRPWGASPAPVLAFHGRGSAPAARSCS